MNSKIKFIAWQLLLDLRRRLHLDPSMNKAQLLTALQEERGRLNALLAALEDSQLVTPGVQALWSVKDILVHIAVWDRRGTTWIRTAAEGGIPAILDFGPGDLDRLNEQTYRENREKPLSEVLTELDGSYRELLAQIEGLPEKTVCRPVLGTLISWRYLHAQRHRDAIHEWLDQGSNQT